MRYFQSSTVSRAVTSGAGSFIFEPSIPMGGGWLGVLAVEEPTASVLAADLPASVWEITEEVFLGVKKKAPETLTDWRPSQQRQQGKETLVVAAPAARPIDLIKPDKVPEVVVASVSLETTKAKPPIEPLLEMPSEKRGARKAA